MSELLLHERTRAQLDLLLKRPGHGLLISGPAGSGKYHLATHLAWRLLGLESAEKLGSYPYFRHISAPAGKREISIDSIRELISDMKLKTLGSSQIRRVAVIENANQLSREAQNALLKNLEEAPADTVIILSSPARSLVLPTIASRVQELAIEPVTLKGALDFYGGEYEVPATESAWRLSGGAVGLLDALLKSNDEHPLKQAVESFKSLLKENRAQRLVRLDKLERDKLGLQQLLDAGGRILSALHKDAVRKGSQAQAARLISARRRLLEAERLLAQSVSPRLVILDLALNLEV